MKFFIMWCMLSFSSFATAFVVPSTSHCLKHFLDDSTYVDSRTFHLSKYEMHLDSSQSLELQAIHKLKFLLHKMNCPEKLSEKKSTVNCHNFSVSLVCEITTDGGYFILADDSVDHVNIIYNRWD